MRNPEQRLADATYVDANGCIVWTRTRNGSGYGQMYLNGVRMGAHRVAYILAKGPIPTGLDLDHLCRNRLCVNPDHLEAVTRSENLRRGEVGKWNLNTEHCPQGHPYDERNTYYDTRGWRGCRACRAASSRAYKTRKRNAA